MDVQHAGHIVLTLVNEDTLDGLDVLARLICAMSEILDLKEAAEPDDSHFSQGIRKSRGNPRLFLIEQSERYELSPTSPPSALRVRP